jgi:hypothetical protein
MHGGLKGAYNMFVGKSKKKKTLGRPRCRLEDNIQMGLKGTGCEGVD